MDSQHGNLFARRGAARPGPFLALQGMDDAAATVLRKWFFVSGANSMTTTVTLSRQAICAGGEHVVIRTTVQGGAPKDYSIEIARGIKPLAQLTEEEREIVLIGLVQLHCRGMTKAQANADLVAGVTLVI